MAVNEVKEEKQVKKETLGEYLDRIHIWPGDDSGFIVQELFKNTEMQVSRRYLECEAWKYLLDKEIVYCEYTTNIWGQKVMKFWLG